MKRALLCVLVLAVCMGLSAQQAQELKTIAIWPFQDNGIFEAAGIDEGELRQLYDEFSVHLANTGKVRVADRRDMDRMIREHDWQGGIWSDKNKTVEVAKSLNAHWLVTTKLVQRSNGIRVLVEFTDLNTTQLMGGATPRTVANVDALFDEMEIIILEAVRKSNNVRRDTGAK